VLCAAGRARLAASAPHRLLCGRLPLTLEVFGLLLTPVLFIVPWLLPGATGAVDAIFAVAGLALLVPIALLLAVGPSAVVVVRAAEASRPIARRKAPTRHPKVVGARRQGRAHVDLEAPLPRAPDEGGDSDEE
tara:strand:- start:1157 stop:1555 length:399 start_codon:yes stop_codon:yes gene_type:complete